MASFEINGRAIGRSHPPYIVAEISANHNGDIERALALIEAAKEAGADAVKLQTYTADTMTLPLAGPDFTISGGLWDGNTLYELYKNAHTPWEWHPALFEKGREIGITVFSTPFDASAVEFLETFSPPVYKIASFELIDLPLIKRVAATGRPIIMSVGMADLGEIAEAVDAAEDAVGLALLHCVSGYPTPPRESNLLTIPHLADAFGVVTGLSDHTLGAAASIAAVALGAAIIEKHFTFRRADGGPDSVFSLEPAEFADLVAGCRDAWDALGSVNYHRTESETPNVKFRRSLYVVSDIAAGELFNEENLRSIRPGYGLPPKHLPDVLGRKAKRALTRGTPLDWSMIV